MAKLLVGNTFPMHLIRKRVTITPIPEWHGASMLSRHQIFSFWGHRNSLAAVNEFTGKDLTPVIERPAVLLSERNYPYFEGVEFKRVLVISPILKLGVRLDHELELDEIDGWTFLLIEF